jgi:hypothetical protein
MHTVGLIRQRACHFDKSLHFQMNELEAKKNATASI